MQERWALFRSDELKTNYTDVIYLTTKTQFLNKIVQQIRAKDE